MSSAQQRLGSVLNHIQPSQGSSGRAALLKQSPDDVVITYAIRTPLTKSRKGALKDTPLEDLLFPLLEAVKKNSHIPPSLIEEIVLGNVLHKEAPFTLRTTTLAADYPATTATSIVSRWCSSGLLAVQSVANQITTNGIDIGLAIGAESMSTNPDGGSPSFPAHITSHQKAHDAMQPMGWTSENVAKDFGVSREEQDQFAAKSFQKAERAQKEGWFEQEIVPVTTTWVDPKTGEKKKVTASKDDGIRYGTTAESLSKIRAAFPQWKPSTTTGGNASQITDGAAAVLLMRRSVAEKLGVPILARFVASTVVGLEPRIMGIGPTVAIPKLLGKLGVDLQRDVDIVEINEAFASMGVYCQKTLGLSDEKLNPRGGAIAFGHPLGCTGARQIVTALAELKRTGKKVAVTSMCVGTGMGMASLIVSEQ